MPASIFFVVDHVRHGHVTVWDVFAHVAHTHTHTVTCRGMMTQCVNARAPNDVSFRIESSTPNLDQQESEQESGGIRPHSLTPAQ